MIGKRRMAALLTLPSIFLLIGLLPAETADAENVEVVDKDATAATGSVDIGEELTPSELQEELAENG